MDCKTKTEILRERYKEYLKPIDPFRPLGHEPAELMPPPGKIVQTCFSLKENFPRGEELIRTLGKRTMLDRLEEYKKFQIPLQCPCENIIQGGDPARKKKRASGPSKPKRVKNELHIVCSVRNLPLAYSEVPENPQLKPQGEEKLGTTEPSVRNIKTDKDICQRKYIRSKAIEVHRKSMTLQQRMTKAPPKSRKPSQKKRPVKDNDFCGLTSKPTAPRRPLVPPQKPQPATQTLDESSSLPISPGKSTETQKEQLSTTPTMGENSRELDSMPTTPGQPLDPTPIIESNLGQPAMPEQQKEPPTTPIIGSNSGGQNTMPTFSRQPFVQQQMQLPTTPTKPAMLPPAPSLERRNSPPTLIDQPSVPKPSKLPTTPRMAGNSNGLNSMPTIPSQPFVPQHTMLPITPTMRGNSNGLNSMTAMLPPAPFMERRNSAPTSIDQPSVPEPSKLPTTPRMAGNSNGLNSMPTIPSQPFVPQHTKLPITPTMRGNSNGLNSTPTITPGQPSVPEPTKLSTTQAMRGNSNGLNSSLTATPGQPFVPQQTNVPKAAIIRLTPANPIKTVVAPQKQPPISFIGRRNSLPIFAGRMQHPIMPTMGSRPTHPRKPVVPPQKPPLAAPTMQGPSSMTALPRQPFVPQQMQPPITPTMGSKPRKLVVPPQQEPPTTPTIEANYGGQKTMSSLPWQSLLPQQTNIPTTSMNPRMLQMSQQKEPVAPTIGRRNSTPAIPGQPFVPQRTKLQTNLIKEVNSNGHSSTPTSTSGQPFVPQQTNLLTTPTVGGKYNGLNSMPTIPGQPFVPQHTKLPITPTMRGNFNGLNSTPTITPGQPSVPEPTKLSTTQAMRGNSNGLNSSLTATPGQPFVPQQTSVPKIAIIRLTPANQIKAVVAPQKQPPISLMERRNSLPILPASDQMQLPIMPTMGSRPTYLRKPVVPPQKVPISIGGNSSGQNSMASFLRQQFLPQQTKLPTAPSIGSTSNNPSKPVIPPQKLPPISIMERRNSLPILPGQQIASQQMQLRIMPTVGSKSTLPRKLVVPPQKQPLTTPAIGDSLFGIASKPTHPRRPVVPPKKQLQPAPSTGESFCGIISKPTQPAKPVVPPRKQPSANPNMDGSTAKPTSAEKSQLPQPKTQQEGATADNTSGLDSMPCLDWFE